MSEWLRKRRLLTSMRPIIVPALQELLSFPFQLHGRRQPPLQPPRLLLPTDAAHARGQGPTGTGQTSAVRKAVEGDSTEALHQRVRNII